MDANFSIDIDTFHFDSQDLAIALTSPRGTKLLLWRGGIAGPAPFSGNFPNDIMPSQSLDALIGEPLDGAWTLQIIDLNAFARAYIPILNSWGINGCAAAPVVSGDCDGDNNVDMADYSCLRKRMGAEPGDFNWSEGGDVNNDDKLWYDDLRLLIRQLRGR